MKNYHAVGIAFFALVILAAALLSGCTHDQLDDAATACDIAAKVIGCVADSVE